ncbi:MAG: mandelate racemase [Candidatus Dormibacteraeota bacterium]|nr:mandelate racemase [Candidatus Dormibacteraeota bacterium]MBV9525430.1 mandelate racemase [Candidatus Dormibacteraeota bacterium]
MTAETVIRDLEVSVYTVPTEGPEADGTLQWKDTVVVVVEPVLEGGLRGLGYAYGSPAMAVLIREHLRDAAVGHDVHAVTGAWEAMVRSVRNLGRPGLCSMAIAAVDIALWDTKARTLALPLHRLLGAVREAVPVYGSGGLTSYGDEELVGQLRGWAEQGIPRVKMKVGMDRGASWRRDLERVAKVRDAVGDGCELFVDANGGYGRTQALRLGREYAAMGVTWFEEPVSSDDLEGLAQLRDALPLDVTAGEYGYHLDYFRTMLDARAVDVMQADAGRCAGITEWLRVAALCAAHQTPLSAHCGPALHAHAACVPPNLRHIEYFHTHARVDSMLFDGVLTPERGELRPTERPGLGLSVRREAAERYLTPG